MKQKYDNHGMKIFTSEFIKKRFTEEVNDRLNNGFILNCNTMGGSQGEIAKVHLLTPNEKVIYCIRLERKFSTESHQSVVELIIEKFQNTNKKYSIGLEWYNTLWSGEGEIIYKEVYYEIGCRSKNTAYTDLDGIKTYKTVVNGRNFHSTSIDSNVLPLKFHKAVLPFVKRQKGCKSKTVSSIRTLFKTTVEINGNIRSYYTVGVMSGGYVKYFTLK